MIPEDSALLYEIIPLGINKGVLDVGMVNPGDIKAKEALNFLSKQNKNKISTIYNQRKFFWEFIKTI